MFGMHGEGLDEEDQAMRTLASNGAIGTRHAVGNLISWRHQLSEEMLDWGESTYTWEHITERGQQ